MATSNHVYRVTLFKIPDEKAQEQLLGMYKTLQGKAVKVNQCPSAANRTQLYLLNEANSVLNMKDGQPYIVGCEAGYTLPDSRNQGYNIAAKTTFASLEDFEFFDKQCSAHLELRTFAKSVNQGSMMVYFQSVF